MSGFDEGDSLTITVAIDGDVLDTASFTIDCVQPAAVIKHDCTGYTVSLDNRASKVDVDFTVTVNGAAKTYTVKAGDTAKATGPVVEDQATTITVSVGKDTIKSEKFTEDCEQPRPRSPRTARRSRSSSTTPRATSTRRTSSRSTTRRPSTLPARPPSPS